MKSLGLALALGIALVLVLMISTVMFTAVTPAFASKMDGKPGGHRPGSGMASYDQPISHSKQTSKSMKPNTMKSNKVQ
jgi:hypothetical protein